MARAKKPPAEPAPTCYGADPIPVPERAAAVPAELVESLDLFAQHAGQIEQTILDLVAGIRVALPVQKKKLSRGETEYEVETDQGETWWVYRQPPNVSLLRFVAEQVRGKSAAREAKAQASTLVLKFAVPGHDAELADYLAALPEETLARYQFDDATLAALAARRPPA